MRGSSLQALCFGVALTILGGHVACRHFTSDTAAKVVDCGSQAVRQHAVRYLGRVNGVLADGSSSDDQARQSLLSLVAEAGHDVIACLVRDQGRKFAENSSANPTDVVSARAHVRAENFLAEQRYTFKD